MFGGAIFGHPEVSSHVIIQAVAVFGQHTLTKLRVYNILLLFGKKLSASLNHLLYRRFTVESHNRISTLM